MKLFRRLSEKYNLLKSVLNNSEFSELCWFLKIEPKEMDLILGRYRKETDNFFIACFLVVGKAFTMIRPFRNSNKCKVKASKLIFINSKNQASTFENFKEVDDYSLFTISPKISSKYICLLQPTVIDILVLFLFILKSRTTFKELKLKYPLRYLMTFLYVLLFNNILRGKEYNLSITSNDHLPEHRTFRLVSSLLGLKTAYVQHAQVSKLFPALSFDFAFLDGKASLDIYKSIGNINNTKVFLTGALRTPELVFSRHSINYENKLIGVALNKLDSKQKIKSVAEVLMNIPNCKIILRVHPALVMDQKYLDELSIIFGGKIVFKNGSLSDFLKAINLLIVGDSNIALDAVISDIPVIYKNMSDVNIFDYYGFLKNNLVMDGNKDFQSALDNAFTNITAISKESVRYYSASYKTEWEGREVEYIDKILKNEI